jgi:DNA-binding NarL/FixJ family response regulator
MLGQDTPTILVSGYATVDIVREALTKYKIIGVMRKERWDLQQILTLTKQALGDMVEREAIAETEKGEEETAKAPVTTLSTGYRVLVVEDDWAWREPLEEFLLQEGHAVETVATYHEAMAMLERAPYDLAVVDFNLSSSDDPENVDGYDLLGHMRQRELPMIVVTGLGKRARPLVLDALSKHGVYLCFDKADFSWPRFGEAVRDAIRAGEWDRQVASLTRRERQIYDYIRQGLTKDKEIAEELSIAPKTVRNYASQIQKKLGVSSRAAIAAYTRGKRKGHGKGQMGY